MRIILLCLILVFISAPSFAEVVLECRNSNSYPRCEVVGIVIKGSIRTEDLSTFKKIMGSVGKRDWCAKDPIPKIKTTGGEKFFHTDVHLDSPGGDVMTALAIGNLMYENALTAFVKEDANCSSACVHILASSPQRVILGQVNIHRQYSNSTDTSYAKISSNFTKIERIAISQFTQAGVSPELWDAMMRVPPQTAKRLSLEEIMRFRLMGTSPALEDALNSCMAKRLGITKQEYLQREAIYDECYRDLIARGSNLSMVDGIKYCNKRAGLEQ